MDHDWSGWPGAYCLVCGQEDATEICTAECVWYLDVEKGICDSPKDCPHQSARKSVCPGT